MHHVDEVIESTGIEPRPYQRTIIRKATDMFGGRYKNFREELEPPAKSVMIESPTGSGKTVMGHTICKVLTKEYPDIVIGWVAMRRNLLTQAAAENKRLGINVEPIHYISMFDKEPDELIAAKEAGKRICLVIDEAQHDAADSMSHIHNILEPEFILGLTATPFRTDRVKLCFDKVCKDAGIHQLIQEGYLSKYEHYSIPDWNPQTVAEAYLREPERWGRSVVFFHQWEQCIQFHSLLMEHEDEIKARLREHRPDLRVRDNVAALVRGGGTKSDYDARDQLLDRFRNGDVVVLVNCMVLTEGFDAPSLETAFVRDSVKGPTMQMAGRAFRIHPEWKDKKDPRFSHKKIVQSKLTKWPILKTAMADIQYLWQQGEWRSLTLNPHLEDINLAARMAIAQATVTLPSFLKVGKNVRRFRADDGPEHDQAVEMDNGWTRDPRFGIDH